MAKAIRQYRYYGENNNKNYPENISVENLTEGSIFFLENNLTSITQLGIQTLPGIKFYLNDPGKTKPIIVGSTGIYELELEGIAEINSMTIDPNSLKTIQNVGSAYLIIDALYEKEEA